MSERVAYAMLALLALIVCGALILAFDAKSISEAMKLLNDIAIGLLGAIGGWSARAALRTGETRAEITTRVEENQEESS